MHALSRRIAIRGLVLLCAGSAFASAAPSMAADEGHLAIQGYDPVAYFTLGMPVPGLPEIEYEWDGHRYLFSRSEHRELFSANPLRYAPQFPNFCANAMSRGELIQSDPKNFLISGGKLYMFGKTTGPRLFQERLIENIDKANRNHTRIRNQSGQ
jgi:YHS domain-containing protein